jgi:UDP-N-acetylglucosamine 2-epimerase (non-hydrolysing)
MIRHVMVVLATRPDCIKLMPVIAALRGHPAGFRVTLCATGQQREMLRAALAEFDLTADIDLDAMRPDQQPADLLGFLLPACHRAMVERAPDLVVVQGDTTSALAAGLAASHARVPLAHLEAGLRTTDKRMPFPEEMNRRLLGQLADLHFAPTETAAANLRAEGVPAAGIHVTGNTVVDAVLRAAELLRRGERAGIDPALAALADRHAGGLVLVTCHRRESFGAPLARICDAVRRLAAAFPDLAFVLPVHPNPNVRQVVPALLAGIPRLAMVEPLAYRELLFLLLHARLVLTDSGGIQEEAPSFGVPVLVMREETDRPEAIAAGFARLVGRDPERIVGAASALLRGAAERLKGRPNPYGDGKAATRVADILAALP